MIISHKKESHKILSNSWMFHVLRIGSDRCYRSPFVYSAKNTTSAYYVQPLPTHRYRDIDPMIPTAHDTQHSSAPRAEVLYLQLMAAVVYMVGNFFWWIRVFGNSRSSQPIYLFDATVSLRIHFILCHLFICSSHRRILHKLRYVVRVWTLPIYCPLVIAFVYAGFRVRLADFIPSAVKSQLHSNLPGSSQFTHSLQPEWQIRPLASTDYLPVCFRGPHCGHRSGHEDRCEAATLGEMKIGIGCHFRVTWPRGYLLL